MIRNKEIKRINKLRNKIYKGYVDVLDGKKQRPIDFQEYFEGRWILHYSGDIEDDIHKGKTYLSGKIKKNIDIIDNYKGIVVRTDEGIELFENYTGRRFRPMVIIPGDKGLIANLTELERRMGTEYLEEETPESLIETNFHYFPILMKKHNQLSVEDYKKFYLELSSKEPIFF